MKKYSILSYNFNNYEILREPLEISGDAEYIYVTDNKKLKSNKWNIVYLNEDFNDYSAISKTMYVRYHPFEFCNTDTVIILDGSMHIIKSLDKLYKDFTESNCDCALGTWISPIKSVESMYSYWLKERNYDYKQYIKNLAFVKATKFNGTENFHETGYMILTKTNIEFLTMVWKSLLKISNSEKDIDRLDQTIFNAILYKIFPELKCLNLSRQVIQSDYIKYYQHNTTKQLIVELPKKDNNYHLI